MADIRTEITEITTGLGALGLSSLASAIEARPIQIMNVSEMQWARLLSALKDGQFEKQFNESWLNGQAFLNADQGLRGRRPLRVEWKGPHRPPGYDLLPADLRIDHVFLISCKNLSKLLMNVAPGHLFDRVLAIRSAAISEDWYETIAPVSYALFYSELRSYFPSLSLPVRKADLGRADREALKFACSRSWPKDLQEPYEAFSKAVSEGTALRWRENVRTQKDEEAMLWRLLRLDAAPYFILGASTTGLFRLRIATPWDWRREFHLERLEIFAQPGGQPKVGWQASVLQLGDGVRRSVEGHVEIRWSHGRFCGYPEAKVYLDTAHPEVPGYYPLQ